MKWPFKRRGDPLSAEEKIRMEKIDESLDDARCPPGFSDFAITANYLRGRLILLGTQDQVRVTLSSRDCKSLHDLLPKYMQRLGNNREFMIAGVIFMTERTENEKDL